MRATCVAALIALALHGCTVESSRGDPNLTSTEAGDGATAGSGGSGDGTTSADARIASGGDDGATASDPRDGSTQDAGSQSDAPSDAGGTTPDGGTCDEGFTGDDCTERSVDYGRRFEIAEGLADPDAFELGADHYVLSGTGSGASFPFFESTDLVAWEETGAYDPSAVDPSYDYCFCWAPEFARIDGTLYFYFSAHRGPNGGTTCPPPSGSEVTTYRAASVDGSLSFGVPELLYQGGGGAQSRTQSGCPAQGCDHAIRIDAAVHGGRLYYVFFDQGNNVGSVALDDPTDLRFHAGPAGYSLAAYEEAINEGPDRVDRDGRAYMFFSAAWYDSQYATFYLMADSADALTRDVPVRRLTTPVRRGNGTLAETHGHNSVVTRHGETFNFFHVGVFDAGGGLIRRDTYRQRIAWNADGSAISQNQVEISWNALGAGYEYSLDLVLRDGSSIGPCIGAGRIGSSTSATFTGICPDASDRLVHKSEIEAFRLYTSNGGAWTQAGEAAFDGYADTLQIDATAP